MIFLKHCTQFKKYLLPIFPFMCFFLGYLACNIFFGNRTYQTPQLIGLSLHEAVEQTSPHHINIQLLAEKECPGVHQGTIISQKPSAGRLLKAHQTIFVITAKQPKPLKAPHLAGLSQEALAQLTTQKRIQCKKYNMISSLPAGSCVAQIPQPDQPINDKKMILYIGHEKPNKYIMPDFINQNMNTIVEFLQIYQIQPTVIYQHQKVNLPNYHNMKIIAQKPLPGSIVNLANNLDIQLEIEKI